MSLFRRLIADVPGDQLAARFAAISRPEPEVAAGTATSEPAHPGDAYLYTLLGVLADNPGVLDQSTPGLPASAIYDTDT